MRITVFLVLLLLVAVVPDVVVAAARAVVDAAVGVLDGLLSAPATG
jgi:hypothetical protein